MSVVNPALAARIVTFMQEVGFDIKALKGSLGDTTQLTTTNKASAVVAINELVGRCDSLQDGLQNIDLTSLLDDAAVTGSNVTWSISKIQSALTAAKDEILGGATRVTSLAVAEAEFDSLAGRVGDLETAMQEVQDKFGADGKVKAEFLPTFASVGIENKGLWDMSTALPAATAENDGWFYITSVAGNYDFDGNGAKHYPAGIMVIGDGNSWTPIDRPDSVTVNGKTGSVIDLVAADIGYTPAASTGLTASTIKGALDSIATTLKDFIASVGDIASVDVAVYRTARDS